MIESLIEEDDNIIDNVLEMTNNLDDLTDFITNFFGKPMYKTARETMLGDMCSFMSDTIQETIVAMGTKACRVRFPQSSANLCPKLIHLTQKMETYKDIILNICIGGQNQLHTFPDIVCLDMSLFAY